MEDHDELRRQGIEVDNNNDPASENTPPKDNKTETDDRTSGTELNWTGAEGIV